MTHWDWPLRIYAAVMVIAWLFAARYFVIISSELSRARKSGEAHHIPRASRGLPPVVIFTKDALPKVEKERRRLVWALGVFVGGWVLGVALFTHGS